MIKIDSKNKVKNKKAYMIEPKEHNYQGISKNLNEEE